jgi:hypothetical protein
LAVGAERLLLSHPSEKAVTAAKSGENVRIELIVGGTVSPDMERRQSTGGRTIEAYRAENGLE